MSWEVLSGSYPDISKILQKIYLEQGVVGPANVPLNYRCGVCKEQAEYICNTFKEKLQPIDIDFEIDGNYDCRFLMKIAVEQSTNNTVIVLLISLSMIARYACIGWSELNIYKGDIIPFRFSTATKCEYTISDEFPPIKFHNYSQEITNILKESHIEVLPWEILLLELPGANMELKYDDDGIPTVYNLLFAEF